MRLTGKQTAPASRPTLELAVGYRLQKLLIARLRSRLMQVLTAAESIQNLAIDASADTILVRDWKGVCRTVIILDEGVMVEDRFYPNLETATAAITGGKRTADQFFGSRKRK